MKAEIKEFNNWAKKIKGENRVQKRNEAWNKRFPGIPQNYQMREQYLANWLQKAEGKYIKQVQDELLDAMKVFAGFPWTEVKFDEGGQNAWDKNTVTHFRKAVEALNAVVAVGSTPNLSQQTTVPRPWAYKVGGHDCLILK